jgi:hypothetical protein
MERMLSRQLSSLVRSLTEIVSGRRTPPTPGAAALRDRNVSFHAHQHCIQQRIDHSGAVDFFNLLTGPELLETTKSLLPEHRERLYL